MNKIDQQFPNLQEIQNCYKNIKQYIHKTPILQSQTINEMAGCEIFFKCENFQKGGAFKSRGAANAILNLSEEQKKNGVITHSSGNHAGAVARMAKIFNIKAYLIMPKNSPQIKKDYVQQQGGYIIDSEATIESRESIMKQWIEKTGAVFIPPFDDYQIITGQATIGLEIYNEIENVDFLLTPISGGGLFSGQCLISHYMSQKTKLIGVEPYLARDAYLSLKSGKLEPQLPPKTIADGLRMVLGQKPLEIMKQYASEILLVTEDEIVQATHYIWKILKILVEPSSATVLAAVLKNKEKFKGKRVALILTGGNVDIQLPFQKKFEDDEQIEIQKTLNQL